MKRWLKTLQIAFILYGLIGIGVYHLQDQFLFHPQKKYRGEKINTSLPYTEVMIPYNATSDMHIVQFKAADAHSKKGIVLYFHGNRKNIDWYAKYAALFTQKQYEVWMIEYPGFGKSTGDLTEQRLYDYALQMYKLARSKTSADSIWLYGKSMGTGIAAQLASIRACKMLILETPYYSLSDLLERYLFLYPVDQMIHYRFPTNQYLTRVTAPILVFHGTQDGVIPYAEAQKLQNLLKPSDRFYTITGGSHNDLSKFPMYQQAMDSVLNDPTY